MAPSLASQGRPGAKRGKAKTQKKPLTKKPAGVHRVPYVPYVRHGAPTQKSRVDRLHFKRDIFELRGATDRQIIRILTEDKLLPSWGNATCPMCGVGMLGLLQQVGGHVGVGSAGSAKRKV